MKTLVTCIQCPTCKDIIYSRAHHDCHYCTCGNIMIDGGFDYVRTGWKTGKPPETFKKYVNASKDELYYDWNYRHNKYGILRKLKA